jgi:hypothetical protein
MIIFSHRILGIPDSEEEKRGLKPNDNDGDGIPDELDDDDDNDGMFVRSLFKIYVTQNSLNLKLFGDIFFEENRPNNH